MISSLIFIPKPVFGNLLRHFWMLFWQGRNIFSVHFTIYVFCCWDLTSVMTMTILRRKGKFWTWIVLLNYAKLLFKSEISNCFWYIFISCSYPVLLSMELLVFDCVFTLNQHDLSNYYVVQNYWNYEWNQTMNWNSSNRNLITSHSPNKLTEG